MFLRKELGPGFRFPGTEITLDFGFVRMEAEPDRQEPGILSQMANKKNLGWFSDS
jgi:hypothetical protein